VGDIVQCDLGMRIVIEVTAKAATAIRLVGSDQPRDIGLEVSKSRIIERRGEDGLKDFLLRKRALQEEEKRLALNNPTENEVMAKGMVKLEPGDKLCYAGKSHTVVATTERRALLEDADGKQVWDKRVVNEFMFTDCNTSAVYRLNEQERAKHLENFLASRKPSSGKESTQPNGTEETKEMKARVKAGKVSKKQTKKASESNGKASSGRKGEWWGFSVNSVLVAAGHKGVTAEQAVRVAKSVSIILDEKKAKRVLYYGSKHGGGASLTAEQLKEFKV